MDGTQRYSFQYFPENFMWSQGMMIAIEMATQGPGVRLVSRRPVCGSSPRAPAL